MPSTVNAIKVAGECRLFKIVVFTVVEGIFALVKANDQASSVQVIPSGDDCIFRVVPVLYPSTMCLKLTFNTEKEVVFSGCSIIRVVPEVITW